MSVQAEAFSSAFASASTCGCDVSGSAEVEVFDEIWVEAVVNAYAETCIGTPLPVPTRHAAYTSASTAGLILC